jgi:glycosyltransferase involved in cell wall biosynthesis
MDELKTENMKLDCSIVVPLYNEGPVVHELYQRLKKVMAATGLSYELIFVDDGSADNTLELLKDVALHDSHVMIVELRRNFGQTPALAAGFDHSRGEVIVAMDGDLQHIPEEIPVFLEKIKECDVVSGWREQRVDNLVMRKIPSRIANWLAAKICGLDIHDFGTTFKAYRRDILKELKLYGELHRFIPALLAARGARIVEVPIKNIDRPCGKSNYGISRTFRVALDLITLRFLLGYSTRPLHFFGRGAWICFVLASMLFGYILFDKLYFNVPIFIAHGPLAMLAGLLWLIACGCVATGLMGEFLCRIYYESTQRPIYSVRNIYNG